MKKYICQPCGYIYDPAVGDPGEGISPGTALKTFPKTGYVRFAAKTKASFCLLKISR